MNQETKVPAHLYSVELLFSDDRLDPSEISARLVLQPWDSLNQPQIQSRLPRKQQPYWRYDGRGEDGYQMEWLSLEEGLTFLLKCLNPKKAEIVALARQFDGCWWAGHFQSSFNGGPTLSPKLLIELGSYGVPLVIENYFCE